MGKGNYTTSGCIIPADFAKRVLDAYPNNPAFPILLQANHMEAVCTLLKALAKEARQAVPAFAAAPAASDGYWTSDDDYELWLEHLDELHQEAKELLDEFQDDELL